jgi:hypothetical protein
MLSICFTLAFSAPLLIAQPVATVGPVGKTFVSTPQDVDEFYQFCNGLSMKSLTAILLTDLIVDWALSEIPHSDERSEDGPSRKR